LTVLQGDAWRVHACAKQGEEANHMVGYMQA
jgi:hypothetical protein